MPVSSQLESSIAKAWPPEQWRDVHVLVAVSGGADSVALLRLLATLKEQTGGSGRLWVAHFDHRVRGEASRQDADWVEQLATDLQLECRRGVSSQEGSRNEAQLRDERHEFLAQTASEVGARYIATGHTADDQAETVLFRLLRGSGLAGLRGIAASRPLAGGATTLVRPLLSITRKELIAYHDQCGFTFREDSTNADIEPTRNWIRHALLPEAEERFGTGVRDALIRLTGQAGESQVVIEGLAVELLEEATLPGEPELTLDCHALADAVPLIAREAIRLAWRQAGWPEQAMTAAHWQTIQELTASNASNAVIVLPGEIHCRRDGQRLVLQRRQSAK